MRPDELLTVDAHFSGDGTVRVELHGELDLYTAPLLARAIRLAHESGAKCVELDLAELTFVDVRGAHELEDPSCFLVHVRPEVRRILDLTFAPSLSV